MQQTQQHVTAIDGAFQQCHPDLFLQDCALQDQPRILQQQISPVLEGEW